MRAIRLVAFVVCLIAFTNQGRICHASLLNPLSFGSLGALNLGAGNYTIYTSGTGPTLRDSLNNILFTGVNTPQASAFNPIISVFAFSSINIASGANITVTGDNPLALLSHTSANLSGVISANGANGGNGGDGAGGAGGAGGGQGGDGGGARGEDGKGPGGGEGGATGLSARGHGAGFGGRGAFAFGGFDDSTVYGDLKLALEAGSGGGGTNANLFHSIGAGGGGGGGAIEIGAIDSILGNGVTIEANGGLGGGGLAMLAAGGSGGGLRFHAPTISFVNTSNVRANGGNTFSGGGRILFVTDSGSLLNSPANLSVNPGNFGEQGTIHYCKFEDSNPVPEPSAIFAFGGPILLCGVFWLRRKRRQSLILSSDT